MRLRKREFLRSFGLPPPGRPPRPMPRDLVTNPQDNPIGFQKIKTAPGSQRAERRSSISQPDSPRTKHGPAKQLVSGVVTFGANAVRLPRVFLAFFRGEFGNSANRGQAPIRAG